MCLARGAEHPRTGLTVTIYHSSNKVIDNNTKFSFYKFWNTLYNDVVSKKKKCRIK